MEKSKPYGCKKAILKVHLKKQSYALKMHEGDDIKCHVNRFKQCVSELLKGDVKIQDKDHVMISLSSLPESYGSLISLLFEGKKKLTMGEVLIVLLETIGNKKQLTHFAYRDRLPTKVDSRASSNTGRSKSRRRYPNRDENWFKHHQKCDVECFYSHKNRHIKTYCKERLKATRNLD